ncbi:hypothetical protein T4D_13228, partial [Trichinella pseudospiralis]
MAFAIAFFDVFQMLTLEHHSAIVPDKNACRHVSICLIDPLIVNIAAFVGHLIINNLSECVIFFQFWSYCFSTAQLCFVLFCFYRLRLISHLCNDECILPLLNLSFTNKIDLIGSFS